MTFGVFYCHLKSTLLPTNKTTVDLSITKSEVYRLNALGQEECLTEWHSKSLPSNRSRKASEDPYPVGSALHIRFLLPTWFKCVCHQWTKALREDKTNEQRANCTLCGQGVTITAKGSAKYLHNARF